MTERQGHYLADVLETAASKLKQLCVHMPARLDQDQRGNLWRADGLATLTLGKQTGRNEWLTEAVGAYRAALEEYTRERVPLDWAGIQTKLGAALWRLGERERGTARLEEAVAACRAALEEYTRERVPLDWAMTQSNLGTALWILGERTHDVRMLRAAQAAVGNAFQFLVVEAGLSQYGPYLRNRLDSFERAIAAVMEGLARARQSGGSSDS